jgi:hypothetical protein
LRTAGVTVAMLAPVVVPLVEMAGTAAMGVLVAMAVITRRMAHVYPIRFSWLNA